MPLSPSRNSHLPTLVKNTTSPTRGPSLQSRYISLGSVPQQVGLGQTSAFATSIFYIYLYPRGYNPSPRCISSKLLPQTPRKREILLRQSPQYLSFFCSPPALPYPLVNCCSRRVYHRRSQWRPQYQFPRRVACSTHVSPNFLFYRLI